MIKHIKAFFFGKRHGNSFENNEIQEIARQRAEEIRRLNFEEREAQHKLKVLRAKQRLEEYRDEINDYENPEEEEESNGIDKMFSALLMGAIAPNYRPYFQSQRYLNHP
jgi:hypothetical protein